ncbi:acyl-CoA dehydrogenase [Kitasatospora sp. NPDC059571]|uniref:acyl-CoA dehydrogenase n=1 Tax=Kitasatospora sp. NPDC059571 TaxID=3346871 RepID=UPI00367F1D5C
MLNPTTTLPAPAEAAPDAVDARVARLEALFGDPARADNPLGHAALLEADEAGRLVPEGEKLLDAFGLNHEFVPAALGGRLRRVDDLVRVLRPVFRRDASLGLGYGVTSFLAAVAVWSAGSPEQRRRTADLLLGGGKLAIAYHELAHGNDFVRNEFRAEAADGGYLLHGRKEVINNAERAAGLVLFSRTSPEPGSRSHSVLLIDKAGLDPDRYDHLPRYRTVGVRGCEIGGFDFRDCPVPADALVGAAGDGVETALRSFQITRSAVPGMVLAGADTALRTVVGFAAGRRLYGRHALDIPHARAALAGAFTDLLICDSLSLAGTRAVHLLPEQTSVYAAAVKYLVPKVLNETMYDVSIVLGANSYVREGDFGIFQKHVRDIPMTSLGHAGSAACQATIIPQLPRLARRSWPGGGEPAPDALFRLHEDLPPLDTDRLVLAAGQDGLVGSLLAGADRLAGPDGPDAASYGTELRALAAGLTAELRRLQEECDQLRPQDRTTLANPHAYALADRYALVLAAAACLGVWQQQRGTDAFLADPAWLVAALLRITRRLGLPVPDGVTDPADHMLHELLARHEGRRSLDLYDTPLAR